MWPTLVFQKSQRNPRLRRNQREQKRESGQESDKAPKNEATLFHQLIQSPASVSLYAEQSASLVCPQALFPQHSSTLPALFRRNAYQKAFRNQKLYRAAKTRSHLDETNSVPEKANRFGFPSETACNTLADALFSHLSYSGIEDRLVNITRHSKKKSRGY